MKYNVSRFLEYTSHILLAKMAEKKKNSQLCSSKKNTDKMYIALVQI
jgi:hypothetical protein